MTDERQQPEADLDDVGETEGERPRDTADLEDVPASADRDVDLDRRDIE